MGFEIKHELGWGCIAMNLVGIHSHSPSTAWSRVKGHRRAKTEDEAAHQCTENDPCVTVWLCQRFNLGDRKILQPSGHPPRGSLSAVSRLDSATSQQQQHQTPNFNMCEHCWRVWQSERNKDVGAKHNKRRRSTCECDPHSDVHAHDNGCSGEEVWVK